MRHGTKYAFGVLFAISCFVDLRWTHAEVTRESSKESRSHLREVPSRSKRDSKERLIRDLFSEKFAKARTDSKKADLAKEFSAHAIETRDDPVGRFVLLDLSRSLAIEGGDSDTVLRAIELLAKDYRVDGLDLRIQALSSLSHKVKSADRKSLLQRFGPTYQDAILADRYSEAERLATQASRLASKVKNTESTEVWRERKARVQFAATEFAAIKPALERLRSEPKDKLANREVGEFRCFVKGDWKRGLRNIARGDASPYRDLARRELTKIVHAADRVRLADEWMTHASELDSKRGHQVEIHAIGHIERALPDLSGLTKAAAESKLKRWTRGKKSAKSRERKAKTPSDARVAIDRALSWLAKRQRDDGSWRLGEGPNPGASRNPNTATALSLLAFLHAGHTPKSGRYKETIERGLTYLSSSIPTDSPGNLLGSPDHSDMYTQGLATFALCEAYRHTSRERLRKAARAGIEFIASGQDPIRGGWQYQPKKGSDTSSSGWQLSALWAAHEAKFVSKSSSVFNGARKFLRSVETNDREGVRFAYSTKNLGTISDSTTAIGLYWKIQLGPSNKTHLRAAERIAASSVVIEEFYRTYHITRLVCRLGGKAQKHWESRLVKALKSAQDSDGSWYRKAPRVGSTSHAAGRLGCTAFSVMALGVTLPSSSD